MSTRALTSELTPMAAIMPKSSSMMPPMTGAGIVRRTAPSLPAKARTMAATAAMRIRPGSVALVRATAPVTSE